ncbi:hypothetical protein ACUN3E_09885 [Streptomyces sp. Ju416(a)]|uniref:hypothetical protein n=1 Tax=Streptomyces sp. Ju416(a) TaxID=3446591 RepID=UPI00403DA7A5
MRWIRGRRTRATVPGLAPALTTGGLIWGFGPWGEESGGVRLELSLPPAAAHRAAGAADQSSAAPIG